MALEKNITGYNEAKELIFKILEPQVKKCIINNNFSPNHFPGVAGIAENALTREIQTNCYVKNILESKGAFNSQENKVSIGGNSDLVQEFIEKKYASLLYSNHQDRLGNKLRKKL